MFDFKDITLKTIAETLILGLFLLIVVGIMMVVLGHILVIVAPQIFGTGLSVTDAILLLLLIRTYTGKK